MKDWRPEIANFVNTEWKLVDGVQTTRRRCASQAAITPCTGLTSLDPGACRRAGNFALGSTTTTTDRRDVTIRASFGGRAELPHFSSSNIRSWLPSVSRRGWEHGLRVGRGGSGK